MKKQRAREHRTPTKRRPVQDRVKEALRRLLRFVELASTPIRKLPWWADILSVLAFAFVLYQIHASLVPFVQPDSAISSSWYDLPITVRNPGDFFSMKDVSFFCDMTEQQFTVTEEIKKTSPFSYYRIEGYVEWQIQQPPIVVPPGEVTSFPCNIAANDTMRFDGAVLPLRLIRLSIKTKYDIDFHLFRWHREAASQTFTWQQVSGGWQWLPGGTAQPQNPN